MADLGTTTTTMQKRLMDCPVCKKPIMATVGINLGSKVRPESSDEWGDAFVTVKPTGLRVSHDCIPKVMR